MVSVPSSTMLPGQRPADRGATADVDGQLADADRSAQALAQAAIDRQGCSMYRIVPW